MANKYDCDKNSGIMKKYFKHVLTTYRMYGILAM